VIGGLVGILGWIGVNPFQPDVPQPGQRATVPDPFLYVGTGDSIHVARAQPCDGLLGLCLGQAAMVAVQALGPEEAPGYPASDGDGGVCHRWRPRQLDTVTICEKFGNIYSFRIDSFSSAPVRIAAPHGLVIELPGDMAFEAERVTKAFDDKPYESAFLHGEGESVFSFDWFLPAVTEGIPDASLSLIGRSPNLIPADPDPCPGTEFYYPYETGVSLSANASATTIVLAMNNFKVPWLPRGC
jgi:hypothetical protein